MLVSVRGRADVADRAVASAAAKRSQVRFLCIAPVAHHDGPDPRDSRFGPYHVAISKANIRNAR